MARLPAVHVEDLWLPVRRRLSRIRGRHRRFDAFLHSLDYVPATSERPPDPRDFIICGSPRSGTTLACGQLFQPPQVVTVMEPWDGLRMAPHELFSDIRSELRSGRLTRGRLDVELLRSRGRVAWTEDELPHDIGPVADDVLVGVKWPTWWQYLDALPTTRFVVCLRDPLEVIDSYRRIGGRLREGMEYPVPLNASINARVRAGTRSLAVRRARLYELINREVLAHLDRPNVFALRYERWHEDPEALRAELSEFLGVELGPWPVEIRESEAQPVSPGVARTVREHVPVAAPLGYPLPPISR